MELSDDEIPVKEKKKKRRINGGRTSLCLRLSLMRRRKRAGILPLHLLKKRQRRGSLNQMMTMPRLLLRNKRSLINIEMKENKRKKAETTTRKRKSSQKRD